MRNNFFTYIGLALGLTFLTNKSFTQTQVNISSCDTVIVGNLTNYTGPNYNVTLTSAPGTKLAFSVLYYSAGTYPVNLYDGATNTAPLVSSLTSGLNNLVLTGDLTSNNITISFTTIDWTPNFDKFRILVRCITEPQNIPVFQPIKPILNGAFVSSDAADYDNDGDMDMLFGSMVYRNDTYFDSLYKFDRKAGVLDGWLNPTIAAADFDNDGLKDIFITGSTLLIGGIFAPRAAIYKNNGAAGFSLLTAQNFAGACNGACAIVDYNNDGKLDISYTGSTDISDNSVRIFKLYLNTGNMNFTDANMVLPQLNGLINAHMSWKDGEGDGDQDLLIGGATGTACVTRYYTTTGSNILTQRNIGLIETCESQITWVDVNKDGKFDIFQRGVFTSGGINTMVPQLYLNNGNNNFTITTTNLPQAFGGDNDWADYDNDGDMDIVMSGYTPTIPAANASGLFKNNGNGQFVKLSFDAKKAASTIKWHDFNNDNRTDIIIASSTDDGEGSYFMKNMGSDSFKTVSYMATANKHNTRHCVVSDLNNDNKVDILIAGNEIEDVDCTNSYASAIVWGRGMEYSGVANFTKVADVKNLNPSFVSNCPNTENYYWRWGDFDSDGLKDIYVTHEPQYSSACNRGNRMRVFKNNGNNNFSLLFNSDTEKLVPPTMGVFSPSYECFYQVTLLDVDNDGVNELFMPCDFTLLKRNGTNWSLVNDYRPLNLFTYGTSVVTGDYNNDGFLDVVVAKESLLYFLKNNKNGKLLIDSSQLGITNTTIRQIKLVDLDGDNDLDLVNGRGIMENRGGKFLAVTNNVETPTTLAVNDFNNDGYTDIVNVGPSNMNYGNTKVLYNKGGSQFFKKVDHGVIGGGVIQGYWDAFTHSFDIDNDGDNDIIYPSQLICAAGASILINERNKATGFVHVVSPNGGEVLNTNTIKVIQWFGNKLSNSVKIELSKDSGTTWQILAAAQPSTITGGTYNWNVIGSAASACFIKITDNTNLLYTDKSNQKFKIIAPIIANAGRDTSICETKAALLGAAPIAGYTYFWSSNTGGFMSSIANPTVSPTVSSVYYLTVTSGGTIAKDTVSVMVTNCRVATALVFPNPAKSVLNINVDSIFQAPNRLVLMNTMSLNVANVQLNAVNNRITLPILPAGIYFYKIITKRSEIIRFGKLIIQ
jgi:hypothetical protein